MTRWRLKIEGYDYKIIYKKGKYNTNADALSRVKINVHETNIPSSQRNEDDELLNTDIRTLLEMPVTPENNNNTKENENDISSLGSNEIPICQDAIDKHLKQFHIKSAPGTEYTLNDRSKRNCMIKDVFIPINNTREETIKFLKENTIADRKCYCYFHSEELYNTFNEVYKTTFDNRGRKLYRCMNRIQVVENKDEQKLIIKKYHEGKTLHRGIQETYKQIKKNYYWINQLNRNT